MRSAWVAWAISVCARTLTAGHSRAEAGRAGVLRRSVKGPVVAGAKVQTACWARRLFPALVLMARGACRLSGPRGQLPAVRQRPQTVALGGTGTRRPHVRPVFQNQTLKESEPQWCREPCPPAAASGNFCEPLRCSAHTRRASCISELCGRPELGMARHT